METQDAPSTLLYKSRLYKGESLDPQELVIALDRLRGLALRALLLGQLDL